MNSRAWVAVEVGMMTPEKALEPVRFAVRRPGATAWAHDLTVDQASAECKIANRTVARGHVVTVDDASGLTDDAIAALMSDAEAHGDPDLVDDCKDALAGMPHARHYVAQAYLNAWATGQSCGRRGS